MDEGERLDMNSVNREETFIIEELLDVHGNHLGPWNHLGLPLGQHAVSAAVSPPEHSHNYTFTYSPHSDVPLANLTLLSTEKTQHLPLQHITKPPGPKLAISDQTRVIRLN